jgi:mono/diheme cytochrome c family protein
MRKQVLVTALLFSVIIFFVTCEQTKSGRDIVSPVLVSKFARPLTKVTFASSPSRLQRGEYLVNGVLRCFHCHAEADTTKPGHPPFADKLGSGRLLFKTDSTYLYAPNISPDKETGGGNWTDDMFVRALRDGIGHDGRALTFMPWWIFRELSDEDLAAVIVYLRSIPPIKNKLPERLLRPGSEQQLQNEERSMSDVAIPEPDTSTLLAKGRYLVTIGECEGCHTAWYKRNPGVFGGGNMIANDETDSVIVSANISPDITGIGGWDDETFIRIIRTGKAGTLHYSMPWIAFKNISDTDLKAMLAALKSLPPVRHQIVNGIKPTLCEVCGEKHGYGDHNKIIPIIAAIVNKSNYASYAGIYADKDNDTAIVTLKDKKLWIKMSPEDPKEIELIPVAESEFNGSGLPSPITFIKNASGKVTGFADHDLVPFTFMKSDK